MRTYSASLPWASAVVALAATTGALAIASTWIDDARAAPTPTPTPAPTVPASVSAPAPAPVAVAPAVAEPAPAPVAIVPSCPMLELRFAYGSATPEPIDPAKLAPLLAYVRAHADALIVVDGHADPTGDELGNLVLSKHRAHRVAKLVIEAGAPSARVRERAFGAYATELASPTPSTPDDPSLRRVHVAVRAPGCEQEPTP